jgi:hypothetical protein
MDRLERAVQFLTRTRSTWVDIHVDIRRLCSEAIAVCSEHRDQEGCLRKKFEAIWDPAIGANSEYGNGLAIIHDVKDHIFFGLGICPLTEIQTLIQIYCGRDLERGLNEPTDETMHYLLEAIHDEMYGPRGQRVYGPLETGTLDLFASGTTVQQRRAAYKHLVEIAFGIMWPLVKPLFLEMEELKTLSLSTRRNIPLVSKFLNGIKWSNEEQLLFLVRDNVGFEKNVRAFVFDDAYLVAQQIKAAIDDYKIRYPELYDFGRVFDTSEYLAY